MLDAFASSGLSQADLARRCGVTRASVNGWLQGRTVNIRPDHLFAAADALGVEARWIATGKGPRQRVTLANDEAAIVREYRQIREDEREAVRLLLHRIAEQNEGYS
jgi:transcriptional regulator with XRE-family HTH domain